MRRGSSSREREGEMAALENRISGRLPLRSQSSDMGDVVGLVKDMAKFLDRLQYENLSEDSEQVRNSMSARIEFVLRSFPSSRHSSVASLDLPPPPPSLLANAPPSLLQAPPPLPLSPPPPQSLNSSSASSSHMSISMEDSRVVEEDDEFLYEEDECYENSGMHQTTTTTSPPLPTVGPPLPSRAPRPSGLGVSEVVDSQKKVDQVQAPTLEFQPQETSTPHTTPRKSFSKTIERSVGPPPLMMSMDTDPDTSGEAGDDTIDEDPLYDSMVNENEPESPIAKKTDPINSSAKVLSVHADHSGWLWRKESLFKANNRFWALVYAGTIYLYTEPKDMQEKEAIFLGGGAKLMRHKKGKGFVVVMPLIPGKKKPVKHEFETVNEEQANEWISKLQTVMSGLEQVHGIKTEEETSRQSQKYSPKDTPKSAQKTTPKTEPKEKPKSPTKDKIVAFFSHQNSFSSSDEESPSDRSKKPRDSAMSSISLDQDDEYETVEISTRPAPVPVKTLARVEEQYDVPRAFSGAPLAPADPETHEDSWKVLESKMAEAAIKMKQEAAKLSARNSAPQQPRKTLKSPEELEAQKARVRARQLETLARPSTVSSTSPNRAPRNLAQESMTMGRRPKVQTRDKDGGRPRTHSELLEGEVSVVGVEVTPRLMQAEMAPILNRIAKEGSYNKPAVPSRPRNLTVTSKEPTASCPPYSQVDRSKPRGAPGTAPKPPLAARPLGTSFLHSMVQSGRLPTVAGAGSGAPNQDRGW